MLGMLCALQGCFTPLMWASKHGHTAVVHALIGAGARFNVGSKVSYGNAVGELRMLSLLCNSKL
jgi:ankyrin repeat protein